MATTSDIKKNILTDSISNHVVNMDIVDHSNHNMLQDVSANSIAVDGSSKYQVPVASRDISRPTISKLSHVIIQQVSAFIASLESFHTMVNFMNI